MACSPTYRLPADEEPTRPIPRLVNAQWLLRALRDQARAAKRERGLPWDDVGLMTRAAAFIELHIVQRRP